ncbi:MAG: hypothetical protein AVDCRST_MAG75-2135, partial [uncultured Propionibacteriaceae bacterium]
WITSDRTAIKETPLCSRRVAVPWVDKVEDSGAAAPCRGPSRAAG